MSTENEIVGEALIALRHEELKEMAILSVGHRLTILKGVYDIKVKQEIPIEPDHYIPPCWFSILHRRFPLTDSLSCRCKCARPNSDLGRPFAYYHVI